MVGSHQINVNPDSRKQIMEYSVLSDPALILELVRAYITTADRRLLEVNAGSGQFSIAMAPQFPFMDWFPVERASQLTPLKSKLSQAKIKSIQTPVRFEVEKDDFPKLKFDVVLAIDTFHLHQWKECKTFMKLLGHRLREGSRVIICGPFKHAGEFLTESHSVLDQRLKEKDPLKGIRAFEVVHEAMVKNGFELLADSPLPEKCQFLVYKRLKFSKH